MRTSCLWLGLALLSTACGHVPLSGGDLQRVHRPAFISRVNEGAGPRSEVFEGDSTWRGKLKRLDPREADRRLGVKMSQAISRFEVGERLRAGTFARLPHDVAPWNNVVNPALVASALESFLVEDVPAHEPDYELLRPLGADAIVEFVVEACGMRSDHGKAGAYARGYGRMFLLDGGELWHKKFNVDQVDNGTASLDPFQVGKNPDLFAAAMREVLDQVSQDFAKELQPVSYRPVVPTGANELSAPTDDVNRTGRPQGEDEIPNDTAPKPSGEEAPPQGEIHMKDHGSTSDEDRPATAPGLQTPTQAPDEAPFK